MSGLFCVFLAQYPANKSNSSLYLKYLC